MCRSLTDRQTDRHAFHQPIQVNIGIGQVETMCHLMGHIWWPEVGCHFWIF